MQFPNGLLLSGQSKFSAFVNRSECLPGLIGFTIGISAGRGGNSFLYLKEYCPQGETRKPRD